MKHLLAALLAALTLFSLTACGAPTTDLPPAPPPAETPDTPPPPPPEPSPEELAQQQVEDLLSSMTLAEKVGQLFFVRAPADQGTEDVSAYHLGGYVLFGRDFEDANGAWLTEQQLTTTLQSYQDAAQIPLLMGVDEEGGTVVRASRNPTLFPGGKFKSPQSLEKNHSGQGDVFAEDAWEKSNALLRLGINVNLAPVADVSTNPGDFIYDRTLGKDAAATADYVTSVVTAMGDAGMGSVLKHFPGYGDNPDTHTGIAVDTRPLDAFEGADFLPFSAGIAAGGGKTAVLVSHNIMTAVDDTLPASLSPAVHDLLRQSLGFSGVVMTDDLAMDAVAAYAVDGAVAVMALEAGNDLVITSDYRTQIPKAIAAVEQGTLSQDTVDAACRRVLTWKQALGLLGERP